MNRRIERSPYLFSGLIRCSCGSPMNAGLFGTSRTAKYRCKAAAEKRSHPGGYVMATLVERAVLEQLAGWAADIDADAAEASKMTSYTAPASQRVKELGRQITKLESKLDQLTLKMLDGTVPQDAYARLRDDLATQKSPLEAAFRAASVAVTKPPATLVPELLENWALLPVETRRDILTRLIRFIEVEPGRPRAVITVHPAW